MTAITNEHSKEITGKFIKVLEHYVNGDSVYCQHKGFTAWGKVEEVGCYRHQWDTRNENYKVVVDGKIVLEVGTEFDDKLTQQEHMDRQRQAFQAAKEILTESNEKVWIHHCHKDAEGVFIKFGEACPECHKENTPNLKLATTER